MNSKDIKNRIPKNRMRFEEDHDGIQSVRNQLFESYQTGVVEDQLDNNIGIHHFNNQKN